jgi:hypothetical protein
MITKTKNMKTTFTMLAILVALAIGGTGYAQKTPEQRVKILPSGLPGVIKLHYAMAINEPMQITFFNAQHTILGRDKIKGIATPFGFSKRYDVNKISGGDFWIEISSSKQVLVYHVKPDSDRKNYTASLEPTSSQLLVKANN